jgi:DNA-binding MarR family transcriptional regulator
MSEAVARKELARIPLICPGYRLRVAERVATRLYNGRLKEAGLSAVQFGLLVGIETSDRPMVIELAVKSGADPSTLARNMQLLETGGLVVSVGGRGRFGKRFALSAKGRSVLRRAVDIWQKAYDDLVKEVGAKRVREGLAFLAALEDAARNRMAQGAEGAKAAEAAEATEPRRRSKRS